MNIAYHFPHGSGIQSSDFKGLFIPLVRVACAAGGFKQGVVK